MSLLPPPLQNLLWAYEVYKLCFTFLKPTSKPFELISITKTHLDNIFKNFVKKSESYDFSLFKKAHIKHKF